MVPRECGAFHTNTGSRGARISCWQEVLLECDGDALTHLALTRHVAYRSHNTSKLWSFYYKVYSNTNKYIYLIPFDSIYLIHIKIK